MVVQKATLLIRVAWSVSTISIVRRSIAIGMIHFGIIRMVGILRIVHIGLHVGMVIILGIVRGTLLGIILGVMTIGDGTILIMDGVFLIYIIHIEVGRTLHAI